MRALLRRHWFFILILGLISTVYFMGVAEVPFHPDESTFLFMSSDYERAISNPLQMAWESSINPSAEMRYRMIDAPLTRYLIGFSRNISGLPVQAEDWDWSATWEENRAMGAMPASNTLWLGRFTLAFFFPLSLILLYLTGKKLSGRPVGILAVLIFSTNPIVLLHTRRAMAEGILVFTLLLALYALLHAGKYPFLAGLAVALAFNTKHSAALLIPVGLVSAAWIAAPAGWDHRRIASNLLRFTAGFGLLTLLFNPFLWKEPAAALQNALLERQALIEQQTRDFSRIAPAQLLDNPGKRVAVAVAQVYIAPPVFSEAGNYSQYTAGSESKYLDSFGSQIGRQIWMAGLLIAAAILGILELLRRVFSSDAAERRDAIILLVSAFCTIVGIILLLHLAWQRYYLPLVPLTSIFAALGINRGIKTSREILSHGRLSERLTEILAQFTPNGRMP